MACSARFPLLAAAALGALACNESPPAPPAAPPSPPPPVSVTISPPSWTMLQGGTQDFTCTVVNSDNTACAFAIEEAEPGVGTLTPQSASRTRYTAPASSVGTFHIVATASADSGKTARAEVVVTAPGSTNPLTPDVPAGTDVTLAVSTVSGRKPISPYIFGLNAAHNTVQYNGTSIQFGTESMPPQHLGITRAGGNNISAHNWETNLEVGLGATDSYWWYAKWYLDPALFNPATIGAAHREITHQAFEASGTGIAALTSVPMLGYVPSFNAGDANGFWTGLAIPTAGGVTTPANLDADLHWLKVLPRNPGGADATPDKTDRFVYTDDQVKLLDGLWGPGNATDGVNHWTDARRRLIVQLDNEPDDWASFEAVRGRHAGQPVPTGYAEYTNLSIEHAKAVKDTVPDALVLAGSWAAWIGPFKCSANNPQTIQQYLTSPGDPGYAPTAFRYYAEYLIKKWKDAGTAAGHRLVDIIDLHPYPQVSTSSTSFDLVLSARNVAQTAALVDARVQSGRRFWDPTFIPRNLDGSYVWDTSSSVLPTRYDGTTCPSSPGYCAPVLTTRFQNWAIGQGDTVWPDDPNGLKVAYTEWSTGRQGDVSAAVAIADTLGAFARTGTYLATYWPMGDSRLITDYTTGCTGYPAPCDYNRGDSCRDAAFRAWRDYDGAGARHGDTYVRSVASDPSVADVHASIDAGNDGRVVLVAVNRRPTATVAGVSTANPVAFGKAQWWLVTGGNGASAGCHPPARQADITIVLNNAFTVTLPAHSVSVFVLTP